MRRLVVIHIEVITGTHMTALGVMDRMGQHNHGSGPDFTRAGLEES